MFRQLLNFEGINWWTLLGGLGFNFVITVFTSLGGAYLATNESTADFYSRFGPPLMVILIFLACGLAGYVVGKIADDLPLKHAFWASLGAVVPFFATAVLSFNPMPFLMAGVALAGAMNGGMLATPRPRYIPPNR
jgi:hypothetical protein